MWLSLSPVEAVVWYWTQLGLLSAIELPESTCVGPSIKCSIQWLSYLRRGGKYVNKHTSWGQKSIAIRTNLYIYNCNLFKVIKKIHCFFSSSFSMQYHSHKIWIFWDEKGICQAKYVVVAGLYLVLILFTLLGFVSPFVFLCEIFIQHWFFAACKLSVRPGKGNICYNGKQRKNFTLFCLNWQTILDYELPLLP